MNSQNARDYATIVFFIFEAAVIFIGMVCVICGIINNLRKP